MSAMKDAFMDLQEQVYTKLENLGVTRENIYTFEELFSGFDFCDYEKMAGYAMTIYFLSETTEYTTDRLWSIWKEHVQEFFDGNSASSLEEEWESFKKITCEKDW